MILIRRRGFTLVELLTVIAIIALLAAILFPVFSRVRESARKTTCMTNLHQMQMAADMFKTDNGRYPDYLGDVYKVADSKWGKLPQPLPLEAAISPKDANNPDDPYNILHNLKQNPDDRSQYTIHYTQITGYLKDPNKFVCPDNSNAHGLNFISSDTIIGIAHNVLYYPSDSYDLTMNLLANGTTDGKIIQVYRKDWTGGIGMQDAPNQLKYNSPPLDKTVLTWCSYHVAVAGADMCPIVLASGTAKVVSYKELIAKTWNIAN